MTKPRRTAAPSTHRYPRTARLNNSLREVIAEELTRIDDERLSLVTITAIDVDPEMNRAIVFFDSLIGEDGDARDPRGAGRPPGAHPGLGRPPAAVEEDADPLVQARRRRSVPPSASSASCTTRPRCPSGRRQPDRRRRIDSRSTRRRRLMARRKPANTHGLAVVDKPAGVTSHDVVGMLRRRFGERQVGHAGTLDPDATGVLLVGVGKCTRLLRFLTDLGKTYTGEVVFGTTTDSLDSTGKVTATFDMSGLTLDAGAGGGRRAPHRPHHAGAADGERGEGRRPRLHELAREGIEVERHAAPGHRAPLRRRAHRRSAGVRRSRCSARRAPTSARWPTTSAGCVAAAPTCATCAAPRSAASPWPKPPRPTRSNCCRCRRPMRDYPQVDRRRRGGGAGAQRTRARPGQRLRGRWPVGGPRPRRRPAGDVRSATRRGQAGGRHRRPTSSDAGARHARRRRGSVGVRASRHRSLRARRGPASAPSSPSARTTACISATRRSSPRCAALPRPPAPASVVVTFDRHPASVVRPEIGAAAAHRPRAEAGAAGRHRRRRHGGRPVRRGAVAGGADGVRAAGARRLPRHVGASSSARTSTSATAAKATSPRCASSAPSRDFEVHAAVAACAAPTAPTSRSAPRPSVGRWPVARSSSRPPCWATRSRPAAWSCRATSAAVCWASRRPTWRCPIAICLPGRRRVRRLVPPPRRQRGTRAPSTSVGGPRSTSTPTTRCSRRTCSTSTATSTASTARVRVHPLPAQRAQVRRHRCARSVS